MDALIGAGIALATLLLTSGLQIWRDRAANERTVGAEDRADRRTLRDAKLERMRLAFLPVVLAAMALRTAAQEYFFSAGDPDETSAAILKERLGPIDDARARLLIEGDMHDVFDELEAMRTAYKRIELNSGRRGEESVGKFFKDLETAHDRLIVLIEYHMAHVERLAKSDIKARRS